MTEFELKPFTHEYDEDLQKYADSADIAANLRDVFPHPYTLDDARGYIQSLIDAGEETQCCRAIIVDGKAVGSIGFFVQSDVYRKSAEIGYWLGTPFHGKGIMTKAVKQMCGIAFEKYDIVRIYAEPFAHNKGSRRVLEKAGFTHEGTMKMGCYKNGEYCDYCMYALIKEK